MADKWTVSFDFSPFSKASFGSPFTLANGSPFQFRHGEALQRDETKTEIEEKDGVIIRTWVWLKAGSKEGFVPFDAEDETKSIAINLASGIPPPTEFEIFNGEVDREMFAEGCIRKAIRWQTNAAYLFALAWIESGSKWPANKVNSPPPENATRAVGTFRFLPETWNALVKKHGEDQEIVPEDIKFPEPQTTFAAVQAGEATIALKDQLGDTPRVVDVFMAHLFGTNAVKKIRDAEKLDPAGKIEDVLKEAYESREDALKEILKRKANLLTKNGPVLIKDFITRAIAEVDAGFQKVKEFADALAPSLPASGKSSISGTKTDSKHLGVVSEEFESRGNASAIGHDSTGGWSYGKYQIASKKGNIARYLAFLDGNIFAEIAKILRDAGGDAAARSGTEGFKAAWRSLKNNELFGESQHGYIKSSHYDIHVKALIKDIGLDVNMRSSALQNVVWSIAVQHGPGSSVIRNALKPLGNLKDVIDETMINKIYDERSNVNKYFSSSKPHIKESVKARFVKERKVALSMLA